MGRVTVYVGGCGHACAQVGVTIKVGVRPYSIGGVKHTGSSGKTSLLADATAKVLHIFMQLMKQIIISNTRWSLKNTALSRQCRSVCEEELVDKVMGLGQQLS